MCSPLVRDGVQMKHWGYPVGGGLPLLPLAGSAQERRPLCLVPVSPFFNLPLVFFPLAFSLASAFTYPSVEWKGISEEGPETRLTLIRVLSWVWRIVTAVQPLQSLILSDFHCWQSFRYDSNCPFLITNQTNIFFLCPLGWNAFSRLLSSFFFSFLKIRLLDFFLLCCRSSLLAI